MSGNTTFAAARALASSGRMAGRARRSSVPGNVAFIPQGQGHYIESVGPEPVEVLILFNSGVYQEISLASWLGANPAQLLEDNFSQADGADE